MTITRMLGLRQLLAKPVTRRTAVVAAGAPLAAMLGGREPAPRPDDDLAGWYAGMDAETASDDLLALSEAEGRITRTVARLERVAAELEARHVRYAWTVRLREELLAIAHDTGASGRS